MKGNGRRAIASIIFATILFISVTYAWILNSGTMEGKFINLDYSGSNPLEIVSTDITVEFYYQDANGDYVLKSPTDTTPLEITGLIPNGMFPFKIRFYNLTGSPQPASLSVSGIIPSVNALMPMMYVGVSGGEGYANATNVDVVKPDNKFIKLSDAAKRYERAMIPDGDGNPVCYDVYDLKLYTNLVIPTTSGSNYVELDGFFWFDREAKIELENQTLIITSFKVII